MVNATIWSLALGVLVALAGCDGLRVAAAPTQGPGHGSSSSQAEGVHEGQGTYPGIALGRPASEESVYGWSVEANAERVTWRHCETPTSCGMDRHERPRSEVITTTKIGRARPNANGGSDDAQEEVDVMELKLLRPKPDSGTGPSTD